MLTAVPRYLNVIGSEEITLGAYKAVTAAADVPAPNFRIFLLENIEGTLDFMIFTPFKNWFRFRNFYVIINDKKNCSSPGFFSRN